MVAVTEQAWRWIDRLGVPGPNPAEPLPPHVYVLATHVAASPERRPARVRVRAADGTWAVIRAAALTTASQVPAGYAVTLEAAPADDLAPLLMRAWRLTSREREVARLVIDGLSTEDIATALFISVHTVRDHLKMIFGKMGVNRRQDMVAALTGRTPTAAQAGPIIARKPRATCALPAANGQGPWTGSGGHPGTTTTPGPGSRGPRSRPPIGFAGRNESQRNAFLSPDTLAHDRTSCARRTVDPARLQVTQSRQDRSGLVLRLTQCYWRSTSATRTLSPLCAANVDLTVPPARDDTERVAATVAPTFAHVMAVVARSETVRIRTRRGYAARPSPAAGRRGRSWPG